MLATVTTYQKISHLHCRSMTIMLWLHKQHEAVVLRVLELLTTSTAKQILPNKRF
jgi:hypothetical protein